MEPELPSDQAEHTRRTREAYDQLAVVWATTTALSTTDSYLRLAGWVFVTLFSALGATIVAAARRAEELTGDPVDKPTR